jgi:hypothetical protein
VEIVGLKLVTHQPVIEPVSALEIVAKRLKWPAETRIRQPEIPLEWASTPINRVLHVRATLIGRHL